MSRREGNLAMKFGKLIKYNMRSNFIEESYTNCGREISTSPFSKKSKVTISNQFVFILC